MKKYSHVAEISAKVIWGNFFMFTRYKVCCILHSPTKTLQIRH